MRQDYDDEFPSMALVVAPARAPRPGPACADSDCLCLPLSGRPAQGLPSHACVTEAALDAFWLKIGSFDCCPRE